MVIHGFEERDLGIVMDFNPFLSIMSFRCFYQTWRLAPTLHSSYNQIALLFLRTKPARQTCAKLAPSSINHAFLGFFETDRMIRWLPYCNPNTESLDHKIKILNNLGDFSKNPSA